MTEDVEPEAVESPTMGSSGRQVPSGDLAREKVPD